MRTRILQIEEVDPRVTAGASRRGDVRRSTRRFCPTSSSCCPRCSSRPASRPQRAARDPRRLGPPARPLAFPGAPLGCAESSVRRLAAEPGAAQRELRAFDEELLPRARAPAGPRRPSRRCPSRGTRIGGRSSSCTRPTGTPPTAWRSAVPWAGVLVAGDYLSAIEIPMLNDGGDIDEYLATLERLRPLLAGAEHIVPGHGPILDAARAETLLEEDLAYLAALAARRADAELPEGRRSRADARGPRARTSRSSASSRPRRRSSRSGRRPGSARPPRSAARRSCRPCGR